MATTNFQNDLSKATSERERERERERETKD